MLRARSRLVLGFHGCDESVGVRLLAGEPFATKVAAWHWLGQGAYFWEYDPERALRWCEETRERERKAGVKLSITRPYVVGAIVDLGRCLDLSDLRSLALLKQAYASAKLLREKTGLPLPENRGPARLLDCFVVDHLYEIMRRQGAEAGFDTVRSYFVEGDPVYPGAELREKNHVQVAVRNLDRILAVFRVDERLRASEIPVF